VIVRPPLPAGPFLVVGLARSGVAASLALRARGAEVLGCDAGEVTADIRAALEAAGVAVHAPSDGLGLLRRASTVVKSPGVPQEAPVVAAARHAGTRVVGELEIGWRLLRNPVVAVTGSNGKTTTVELVGHIHREAGVPVAVAGNVGTPVTALAGVIGGETVVVCEASSFQLEDTEAFARQPDGTLAVAPADLAGDLPGRAERVTFGPGGDVEDRDGRLWWRGERLLDAAEIRLRGDHNRQNAMAAAAICLARGLPVEAVRAGLASFGGVAHRMEEVARRDGVLYVNDSKATNVASAVVALASFPPGTVHAILGGRGKGSDYAPLARAVKESARAAYLIGESAGEIRAALGDGVPIVEAGDLGTAVHAARAAARPGDVVLLSPASASYDQYRSFEERGDHFRALVGLR